MVVEPGCCLLYGGLAPPRLDSSPVSGYGACFRSLEWRMRWREPFIPDRSPGHAFVPIARAGTPGYENLGRWAVCARRCLRSLAPRIPLPWIPASARMTNSVAGDKYFRTNRPCRLPPAHQGMKIGAPVGRWR